MPASDVFQHDLQFWRRHPIPCNILTISGIGELCVDPVTQTAEVYMVLSTLEEVGLSKKKQEGTTLSPATIQLDPT